MYCLIKGEMGTNGGINQPSSNLILDMDERDVTLVMKSKQINSECLEISKSSDSSDSHHLSSIRTNDSSDRRSGMKMF